MQLSNRLTIILVALAMGIASPIFAQVPELTKDTKSAGELNNRRVNAVEDAIKTIESATTQPELRTATKN